MYQDDQDYLLSQHLFWILYIYFMQFKNTFTLFLIIIIIF